MNVPVFVSRPTPHLASQAAFVAEFESALADRGLDARTLGPGSSYDYEAPLVGIRRMLAHCCGLVSIAFRRTHAPTATRNRGTDLPASTELLLEDLWFTSPYCQIEPAMAFQLGLPILILREQGVVAEGILEKGVTGLYMPEFRTDAPASFIRSEECKRLLEQWGGYVRSVYNRRGNPPKLFD